MTHDDVMTEIRRDESWLADTMPIDLPVSLERIKLRARIEVNHLWLEQNATPDPSAGNIEDVKRAVGAEVEDIATARPARDRRGWRWVRRGAGLAAAAAVVFGVGLMLYRPQAPGDDALYAVRLDDWIDAVVLDTAAPADDSVGLASLKDAVASLEMGLSEEWADVWLDEELDNLGEDLAVLLTEIG